MSDYQQLPQTLLEDKALAKRRARSVFITRVFVLFGIIVGAVVGGVMVYTVTAIRDTQQQGSPAVRQIIAQGEDQKELLATIRSCTDPKGACYQEGQTRTGEVLVSIQQGMVYAISCGVNLARNDPNVSAAEVQDCVADLIAADKP